jgi:hypothetical protein
MRLGRYLVRHRLTQVQAALGIWAEYVPASVKPPVFSKLKGHDRARLEEAFAVASEELTDELGRDPEYHELAERMSVAFKPTDRAKTPSEQRVEETATRQIRELLAEASAFEYSHLGPAR